MVDLPELPDDVWIDLIVNYTTHERDRCSLASTNKHLRELTLPSLFQRLAFTRPRPSFIRAPESIIQNESDPLIEWEDPVSAFTYSTQRTQSLHSQPALQMHVREVFISEWSTVSCAGSVREKAEILAKEAFRSIVKLLATLPRLERLEIHRSPITLELHSLLPRISLLEFLSLQYCEPDTMISNADLVQGFHSLKELVFLNMKNFKVELDFAGLNSGTDIEPYFMQLLGSLTSPLIGLCVSHWCIPHILSVGTAHLLPLLYLVSHAGGSLIDMSLIYRLVAHSPAVREVKVMAYYGTTQSVDLPADALPNLESVTGPVDAVCALVPGRPVHCVRIINLQLPTPLNLDPLRASGVAITSLAFNTNQVTVEDIEHCGHVFTQLRHFTISLFSGWPDEVSGRYKELKQVLLSTLPLWPHLLSCHVGQLGLDLDDGSIVTEVNCPIARSNDPTDRGHPSLEELQLLSRFTWIWSSHKGWKYRLQADDDDTEEP